MKQINFKPVAIFALNNKSVRDDLKAMAEHGIKPDKELYGSYNGYGEAQYLKVLHRMPEDLNSIIELCRAHKQDCVMVSRNDRSCYLINVKTGKTEELGFLRSVGFRDLTNYKNWTGDLTKGTYYVVN